MTAAKPFGILVEDGGGVAIGDRAKTPAAWKRHW